MVMTLPVREVVDATPRSRIVRLDLCGQPFAYQPGQAVFVGVPGQTRRTPFSLAAAPEEAAASGCLELLIAAGATGWGSAALGATAGARLEVEGPVGQFTFSPVPGQRRFLFLAAGSGIAPVRAMVTRALKNPHHEVCLVYSVRTAADFAYHEELQTLAVQDRLKLLQTVTRPSAPGGWAGRCGRIDRALLAPLVEDPQLVCLVCGPAAFVQEMQGLLVELGLPLDRIVTEQSSRTNPVQPRTSLPA